MTNFKIYLSHNILVIWHAWCMQEGKVNKGVPAPQPTDQSYLYLLDVAGFWLLV